MYIYIHTRGVRQPVASCPSLNAPLLFSLLLCKIIIRAYTHTCVRLNSYCCAAERSRLSIDRDMRFHLAIMMAREPVYAQSFITPSLLFLSRLYFIFLPSSSFSLPLPLSPRCTISPFHLVDSQLASRGARHVSY